MNGEDLGHKEVILYKCDPLRNTACTKVNCKACGVRGGCDTTRNPAFAIHDEKGEPVVALRRIRPISEE